MQQVSLKLDHLPLFHIGWWIYVSQVCHVNDGCWSTDWRSNEAGCQLCRDIDKLKGYDKKCTERSIGIMWGEKGTNRSDMSLIFIADLLTCPPCPQYFSQNYDLSHKMITPSINTPSVPCIALSFCPQVVFAMMDRHVHALRPLHPNRVSPVEQTDRQDRWHWW